MKEADFLRKIIEACGGDKSFWLMIEETISCDKCPACDRCKENDGIFCSDHLQAMYDECVEG